MCKYSDERCAKATKLVLFDEFIKIDAKKFKYKTEMLSMNESVLQTQDVVIIVLVELGIELYQSAHIRRAQGKALLDLALRPPSCFG